MVQLREIFSPFCFEFFVYTVSYGP